MEAAFVVYFISQLDDWIKGCQIAAFISGLLFGLLLLFGFLEDTKPKVYFWAPLVVVFVVSVLFATLLPSKKTAEYMAGAYGVQYAVQSKTGQQVLDKSGKIVNNVLDLAIQKTTPSK